MRDMFGKLERLTVKGFKSIRKIDGLELTDINIVIGQNGAGKSNLISLFRFIPKIDSGDFQNYVTKHGGIRKILFFGPKKTSHVAIRINSNLYRYGVRLEPTIDGALQVTYEESDSLDADGNVKFHYNSNFGDIPGLIVPASQNTEENTSTSIRNFIESWGVYHFHDTSENAPLRSSTSLVEPEKLAADGANLAAFLYLLQERYPDSFSSVVETVQQVAPFLDTLVLRPEALNPHLIRLRWRHVGHDELFDVSDLSDGTLRFIALTALLLQPDPPSTIVLDEPELGLHPAAITQLAALIHQVAPTVQIIAATQSPTFANHFGWQDFIIVDRHENASRFRRLREEEVSTWMDDYAMGEIWEKNLIGGRP